MRLFLVLALLLTSAPVTAAGPFGVEMGDSVTKHKGRRSLANGAYKVAVPMPNAEFESYTALASPTTGICKIWGIGRDYDNDRYGNGVRSAYETFKSLLIGKYGSGDEINFLRSGALWKDSDEWVMSVKQKERTLVYYWAPALGSKLPGNIVGISLEVHATGMNSAYLDLTYEFANFKSCKANFQAVDADGL